MSKKKAEKPAHSVIGASSMDRWSVCPGSVRLCRDIPNPTSEHAARGTFAHTVAEECLRKGGYADSYVGETRTVEGHEIKFEEEDAAAVDVYLEYVRAMTGTRLIEHKFDLSHIYPGLYGTSDCVVFDAETRVLSVIDYKHGSGKLVDVGDNNQLRYYAYGALVTAGFPAREVHITIVQPRCQSAEPIRTQKMPAIDLLDFSTDLIAFAKATEDPFAPLNPGDHCRAAFCPAQATCPALKERANVAAAKVFELAPQDPHNVEIVFSPEELAKVLHDLPMLEARIEALRQFAYTVAERTPGILPGWKIVEKVARRKWAGDAKAVASALELEGLDRDSLFEDPKLKGITEMTKLMVAAGIKPKEREAIFATLTTKESSGHTLAPEDDKRPAVVKQLAADVFASAPM